MISHFFTAPLFHVLFLHLLIPVRTAARDGDGGELFLR